MMVSIGKKAGRYIAGVWLMIASLLPLYAQEGYGYQDEYEDYIPAYEDQSFQPRTIDDATWEELHQALDYSGQPPPPPKAKKERDLPDLPEPWDFSGLPDLSPLLKVLLVLLVLAILGWLAWILIQQSDESLPARVKENIVEEEAFIEEVEKLEARLDEADIPPWLKKAEAEGHYHLAVRL
ncbi:MAG: hypothetical protein R2795_00450 [Saprospiraceae bacterium]